MDLLSSRLAWSTSELVSSRRAKATQRNPVLKNKKGKKKVQVEEEEAGIGFGHAPGSR